MFENWKWFHWKFHNTEDVKIEGKRYIFCRTCKRYVPPMPVGKCVSPKCSNKIIICGFAGQLCNKCGQKRYRVRKTREALSRCGL